MSVDELSLNSYDEGRDMEMEEEGALLFRLKCCPKCSDRKASLCMRTHFHFPEALINTHSFLSEQKLA